jgi:hypothetical protein
VTLAIAVLTLTPAELDSDGEPPRPSWCVGCEAFGTLDVFNNVVLFVPLGIALASLGWRYRSLAGAGALLSVCLELLQLAVVPGRYPSLNDVLCNSTGCVLGGVLLWQRATWFNPRRQAALALSVVTTLLVVAVLAATAFLLHLDVPQSFLVLVQKPRHRVSAPFEGSIHEVVVNGRVQSESLLPIVDELRQAPRLELTADVTTAPETPAGVAPIVRLIGDRGELAELSQDDDKLIFTPQLRSRGIGLRTLSIELPDGLPWAGERARLGARLDRTSLQLTAQRSSGSSARHLNLTIGLGWALIVPAHIELGPWTSLVSAAWLGLLVLPCAFYATRRSSQPAPVRFRYLVMPLVVVVGGVVFAPAIFGIASTPWHEWAGMILGASLGSQLARMRPTGGWIVTARLPLTTANASSPSADQS